MTTEYLRLIDSNGDHYLILVSTVRSSSCIELTAICDENSIGLARGTEVARWRADFESAISEFDSGYVSIGSGFIEINTSSLRGIGLGSLLMRHIVLWIKQHPNVPVVPITLSGDDALSERSMKIRNRFYEKLGFRFDYKDGGVWGDSLPLSSHDLVTPEDRMSRSCKLTYIHLRPPKDFGEEDIGDFVSLVLAGGEVNSNGLKDRVMNAYRLAFMRRNGSLVGVAALKSPKPSYRARVAQSARFSIPNEIFTFELGWVFVVPSSRGTRLSFPLCEVVMNAADGAGVFATSGKKNVGMHATMEKLGFTRAGSEWASKQTKDSLLLFTKLPTAG